jgi:hypothetical protein
MCAEYSGRPPNCNVARAAAKRPKAIDPARFFGFRRLASGPRDR